ncbi:MAG: T9SS type A sorting domain-containing protein, partial [Bacteroidia bacterium]|nr:T9SS type A sorting domain-containing protein [Bacteroidia bacterium]
GNFVALDVRAPLITPFTLSNTASTGDRTFLVSITDQTGIPVSGGLEPKVYFSKSSLGTFSSAAATRISGTAQNGIYSFTISATALGGLSLNDSVYAFVVAQDSSTNNYLSSFPAGVNASNVNTLVTPPAQLIGYRIVPGFIGNINVGAGQVYTTLTDAGGLFEAINAGAINGNVTALITSDITETGLHGLNQINESGAGNYTFTIAPSDSVERLIAGSVAGGLIRLNGADRVKIDGRFNGNGRYLRFRNRVQNGFTINLQNDAMRDTITHCHIESVNNTVGTISFLGTNVAGGFGNDSNAITFCIISDTLGTLPANNIPNTGFFSQGTAGIGNDYNTFANNEIVNFGFNGVNLATTAGDFWNISNNSFYRNITKANVLTVLQIDGGTNHIINGNSIGGSSANRSGDAFRTTSTTNPNIIAVRINNAATTATISNNLISNIASTSALNLINISAGTVTVTNNTIGGGAMPYDTIQNGFDNGIINVSGGVVSITNNTIGNIAYYDGFGDRTSGITVTGGTATITGNTIRNIRGNSSGTAFNFLITGMHLSGGANHIVEGNTIHDIQNTNTGALAYTTAGINIIGGTNLLVQRNRIHTIFGNGIGAGASSNQVFGIYTSTTGGLTVRNNQITIGNLTSGETRAYGIQDVAGSGVNNYFYNSILLTGQVSGGANNSYCLHRTGLVDVNAINNIFYNNRRTLGTGSSYATGSNSLTGVTPNSTNYNLYIVGDTARVNEGPVGFANSISVFNTLYTNANTYSSNWYAVNSQVPVQTLFVDSSIGNLNIITTNENAWYVHGKGLALAGHNTDFNNNTRSAAISSGATDIGSHEFNTSVNPPLAQASAAPAANTTTTYTFGARQIASVQWGSAGTVPSDLAVRYYSGVNPPSTIAGSTFFNAYHQITATGGTAYSYQLNLLADSAIRGSVANMNVANMARLDASWQLLTGSATQGNAARLFTTASQSAFGIFTGTQGNNNPLPVSYLSFAAKSVGSDVALNWQTASELNNKGFYVERSVDGTEFTSFGFIAGKGNSSKLVSYQTVDPNAFENAGVSALYYRLRQVDFDGTEQVSESKLVALNQHLQSAVLVFPNPFTVELSAQVSLEEAALSTIQITDINGKILLTSQHNLVQGMQNVAIPNANELSSGVYFVKISTPSKIDVVKVIKY